MKSLPQLEQPLLRSFTASRYTPVTLHGEPIDVVYTFHVRLTRSQNHPGA